MSWYEKLVLGTLTNLKHSNARKDLLREIRHPKLSFIRLLHRLVLVFTVRLDFDYSLMASFLFEHPIVS